MPDPSPLTPAVLPLDPDSQSPHSFGAWKARRDASRDQTKKQKKEWDTNLDRLLVKRPITSFKDEVVVPKDYANVQQKLALMAFQVPQIALEPDPLNNPPMADPAVRTFQAVINHYLVASADHGGVNAAAMIEETLMDGLSVSGLFACKIHYENTISGTKQIQTGQQPDPNAPPPQQPGSVLGLGPTPPPPMIPIMESVPNIVSEHYRMDRLSPAKLLIPEGFTQSDYERAPYLGFDFVMDWTPAVQNRWAFPTNFASFVNDDDQLIGNTSTTSTTSGGGQKRIKGSEIWYKASLFDATVTNPDQLRVLVLIDGLDAPAEHRDSPYQRVGPDGSLTGMLGFPIHVGALRYIPDTCFPPADTQMSKHQVNELSEGRTQMIRQRKRNIPLRVGRSSLGDEFFAKVEKGVWQGVIPLADEHFADPNGPLKEIATAKFPRENFEFNSIAEHDIAVTWALDVNQTGVASARSQTATEVATVQANSNIRLRKERNKYLDWFGRGAAKLGALIQLFADQGGMIQVPALDGTKESIRWDKTTIQGGCLYSVVPNSAIFIDENDKLRHNLQQYNLLINSPYVNGLALTTDTVKAMGLDPSRIVQQPQPRPAEVPKISYAFNGEDLNPANPSFPLVIEILRQGGVQLDDGAIQAAQQHAATLGLPSANAVTHGPGPVMPPPPAQVPGGFGSGHKGTGQVQPLNKHLNDESGARSGPKPLAPGQVA